MRVPFGLSALLILVPAIASGAQLDRRASPASPCPLTSDHPAATTSVSPYRPLRPQKLTELPPGTAFMAVYRHIGNCEAPLTMVEYRSPTRH